jgi:hypothetical protein
VRPIRSRHGGQNEKRGGPIPAAALTNWTLELQTLHVGGGWGPSELVRLP